MTDSKKRRMSMLDSLASAGAAPPSTSMMSSNRALRSARDAVDSHNVWELDPDQIEDARLADRLDPGDVLDLRDAIETNGQVVPILVRRHPNVPDRYLLVYGRRRLEAIRQSDKVTRVRALIASMDDQAALTNQISENMARRDLSFIEKALFASELIETGFGNQSQVAEVLTVTKSSISMAMSVVEAVGTDLIRAIGPAHGIGRPRWEVLAKRIGESGADGDRLIDIAARVHSDAALAIVLDKEADDSGPDTSVTAFEAVVKALGPSPAPRETVGKPSKTVLSRPTPLRVAGARTGALRRTSSGIRIDLDEGPFADWVASEAGDLMEELHARWLKRAED